MAKLSAKADIANHVSHLAFFTAIGKKHTEVTALRAHVWRLRGSPTLPRLGHECGTCDRTDFFSGFG
jgi:hypothetical protein